MAGFEFNISPLNLGTPASVRHRLAPALNRDTFWLDEMKTRNILNRCLSDSSKLLMRWICQATGVLYYPIIRRTFPAQKGTSFLWMHFDITNLARQNCITVGRATMHWKLNVSGLNRILGSSELLTIIMTCFSTLHKSGSYIIKLKKQKF